MDPRWIILLRTAILATCNTVKALSVLLVLIAVWRGLDHWRADDHAGVIVAISGTALGIIMFHIAGRIHDDYSTLIQ